MHSYQLREMTSAVADALGQANNPKAVSAIEAALGSYWADKIALTWTVEDVMTCLEEKGVDEALARKVLDEVLRRQSADTGVTWDTIWAVYNQLAPAT